MSSTPSWLTDLLDDPGVTDVCVNGPDAVFVDRGAGMERVEVAWPRDALFSWALERISAAGKSWDARLPFVDAAIECGHRLHVAFPPLARQGVLVSIRRLAPAVAAPRPGAPPPRAWGSPEAYATLLEAVRRGDSLILCGATGTGKTTLASELLSAVPAAERIIALEDTPELRPDHPHFLSLVTRPPNADGFGEVGLRTLLRQTLRMRPDRIVLGECRGEEVLDLLLALNTGHRGALATLHANSCRDALRRIELLCQLSGTGNLPIPAVRELLASGIGWIAHLERAGKSRVIAEINQVVGREQDTLLLRPVLRMATCSNPLPPGTPSSCGYSERSTRSGRSASFSSRS